MTNERKKIAIIHPVITMGGAGAVAIWTIEALKDDYNVTLITLGSVNLDELNNFFGSNIRDGEITVKKVWRLFEIIPHCFLLKVHLAQRYYKQHRNEFDLGITTICEIDFGDIGIQYIHFPLWNDQPIRKLGQLGSEGIHAEGLWRDMYKKLCATISDFSENRMKKNVTLVNSNWTGKVIKEAYGIDSQTVYPPVPTDFPDFPWEKREEGFTCIGAVTPQKRIVTIIEIVEKIRHMKPQIHLHIIGKSSNIDHEYARKIDRLCAENTNWLCWEKGLDRKQLTSLVARHKYGIHGMLYEHFGIAVAEMAKAGCIPFVHEGGGQVEIVKNNKLIYKNVEDAVQKISYVITNSAIQKVLREQLLQQSQQFSIETFVQSIRLIVQDVLLTKELNVY